VLEELEEFREVKVGLVILVPMPLVTVEAEVAQVLLFKLMPPRLEETDSRAYSRLSSTFPKTQTI
jgi:hypothetical protein